MSSSDKRRKARTQGRFSNPRQENLSNKEVTRLRTEDNKYKLNPGDIGSTQCSSLILKSSEKNQSGNSDQNTPLNNLQDALRSKYTLFETNKHPAAGGTNYSHDHQFSKDLDSTDFQTKYLTNVPKPLADYSAINESYRESCNLETNREKCIDEMKEELSSLSGEVLTDGLMENVHFGKSIFTYEPTEIKEAVKEKRIRRISELGWHTLSTEPSGKSEIYFNQEFICEADQKKYFHYLNKYIKWELKEVVSYGTKYPQPRMVAWFGPFSYGYSGVVLKENNSFPQIIHEIKNRIERLLWSEGKNVTFNSVLLNKYRDGKDSVAWHSDNELSMGVHPLIASISLGDTRRFELKKKQLKTEESNKESAEIVLFLESGSLVIMDGVMQQDWLHRVPREFHDRDIRINLTFRTVFPIDKNKIFQRSPR